MKILLVLFITFIAGIIGTLIGALLGLKSKKDNLYLAMLLAISLGMMLAMVSFDLLPESLEGISIYTCSFIILVCIGIMLILDSKLHHHHSIDSDDDKPEDLHHHQEVLEHNKNHSFYQLALMMILSVSLHNFPEGLAIGSSSIHSLNSGLLMSLLLMLHNIPEGMGMMVSLVKADVKNSKAIMLVSLSGISTMLGGLAGVILGNVNGQFVSIFLAIAAGCMLYVIFFELIPQIHLLANRKKVIICEVIGYLFGFLLINMMHI